MNSVLSEAARSVGATLLLTLLCCGAYPTAVTLAARTLFPHQANGSPLRDSFGTVRGSIHLAQPFTQDAFFHPRPSNAGTEPGFDALASGGANLGPTSARLVETLRNRATRYRQLNHLDPLTPIPADAITTSASGLDPHISQANARIQATRVARSRNLPLEAVLQLVQQHAAPLHHGVNVVTLNHALGDPQPHPAPSKVVLQPQSR